MMGLPTLELDALVKEGGDHQKEWLFIKSKWFITNPKDKTPGTINFKV